MTGDSTEQEYADDNQRQGFSHENVLLDHEYRLHPRVQIPMLGGRVFFCMILIGLIMLFGLGLPTVFLERYLYTPSLLWIVAATFILWPLLAYRFWGFQLRKYDIIVRSGVLFRREISIPWSRIQQVDSRANPLDRLCGLKRLVLHSAGSRAGRTAIPGVKLELADALQSHLANIVEGFHGAKTDRLAKFREMMKARSQMGQVVDEAKDIG